MVLQLAIMSSCILLPHSSFEFALATVLADIRSSLKRYQYTHARLSDIIGKAEPIEVVNDTGKQFVSSFEVWSVFDVEADWH